MSPPRHSEVAIESGDEFPQDFTSAKALEASFKGLGLGNGGNTDGTRGNDLPLAEVIGTEPNMTKPEGVESVLFFNDSRTLLEGTRPSPGLEDVVNKMETQTSVPESLESISIPKELVNDPMESSISTLRPGPITQELVSTPNHPTKDGSSLEPMPLALNPSHQVSRSTASELSIPQYENSLRVADRSPTRSDAGFDEKHTASEDERETEPRSEIQSIMDQFSEEGGGPGVEEVMSPRLEFAGPLLGSPIQHPPRKSSLEPMSPGMAASLKSVESLHLTSPTSNYKTRDLSDKGPAVPPKPGSIHSFGPTHTRDDRHGSIDSSLPSTGPTLHRPPPPEPEPEPDLPFDFHRFLEQLRHRTADPVAKFLRSFLLEFGKKQWMVHEQVKIIGDFLAFITNKMAQCDVWREVSDAEFDNAREGMEKLVMNRLYTQTFSPAIPMPQPIPGLRSRRKNGERPLGPGRRGQHQEDVERDDILAQKVSIYGWVREEHLDIPAVGESGRRFLVLAQQELLKIKTYRAPRDKIICVLNCCKVIFGLLKHSKSDSSADSFMPLLIYTVLQANPEHLVSNVQYILRFRNQDKLGGEAGYYLSSLMGAVQFIENLDRTTLTISDEEFEKHVEAAVFAIAEKHQAEEAQAVPPKQLSEKATLSRPEITPRHSMEGESSVPRKSTSSYDTDSGDAFDEKAAISGLLRTIQRPLTSIGRIFSDESSSTASGPARTPLPGNTPRISPAPRRSADAPRSPQRVSHDESNRNRLTAEDAAARQASAEAAEAHREQRAQHANVVETLASMFPDLDRDIIGDVVTQKNGRVGLAVDACLALSS